MPTNLTLGNRPDPTERQIDGDGDDADDPERLGVVLTQNAEDDGKDDTAEVAGGAGHAGYDAY